MKKLFIAAALGALVVAASGCGNQQIFDVTYTFNRAEIKMPDGTVVSGEVESWRDYDDSDQLQVVIDGTTYLSAAENIVLIADREEEEQ